MEGVNRPCGAHPLAGLGAEEVHRRVQLGVGRGDVAAIAGGHQRRCGAGAVTVAPDVVADEQVRRRELLRLAAQLGAWRTGTRKMVAPDCMKQVKEMKMLYLLLLKKDNMWVQ